MTRDEEIQHLTNLYEGFCKAHQSLHIEDGTGYEFSPGALVPGYIIYVSRSGNEYKIVARDLVGGWIWSMTIERSEGNQFKRPFWRQVCREMERHYIEHKKQPDILLPQEPSDRFANLL